MSPGVLPTLLIVDDESHMRRLLQFALNKTGAKLLLAANGREALEHARREADRLDGDRGIQRIEHCE